MSHLLQRLFQRGARETADEKELELEQHARDLWLELEERNRTLANLKQELERQRDAAETHIAERSRAQMERLLSDVATPITQLLTQAHLLEVEDKPVQARDVLAVAKRLVRALEDYGLKLEGTVGETIPFDPNRHEPLALSGSLTPDQPVVVRFAGVAYQDKVLRKAGVEPVEG